MVNKSREKHKRIVQDQCIQRSINQGVYTLLLECLRGWYRRRRCRRRHRACLDGANKIRPQFHGANRETMVLILFPYRSGRRGRKGKHDVDEGINRGKEGRRKGGEVDKTMVQRKRQARSGPEGPGAYKGDAKRGS